MCGVIGGVSLNNNNLSYQYAISMLERISHRGKDGRGLYYTNYNDSTHYNIQYNHFTQNSLENFNLFLGHNRLAIQDLRENALQPMKDASGDIWLSYNGEIYNFQEIKEQLEKLGYYFRTNSDTEVIIYAYIEWGIEAVNKFNGMFAFALFDSIKQELYLVRDRYGIKPLYYSNSNSTILFASEVKSILEYKEFSFSSNKEAFYEYFTFQNIFTNKTFHNNIHLLEAGHILKIDLHTKKIEKSQYWDFDFSKPLQLKDDREYIEELDRLFNQAVKRQMVSDVEIGSYLSGGIDSSSIVSILSQHQKYFKSFTVGFDLHSASGLELTYDEREKAEYLSYIFQTEHYEMILKAGDMQRCLPNFTYHLEEPRVGQSYPNYYAAKLASRFVKVVFSGIGGDEIFAGYPWRYYRTINSKSFQEYTDNYYEFWQRLVPNEYSQNIFNPMWNDIKHISPKNIFVDVFKHHEKSLDTPQEYINHSLYFEAKTFLHGLLLVEDKLSMAHTLETRVPFLDNDLVDFAQQIPVNLKLLNLEKVYKMNENEFGNKTNKYYSKTKDGKLILRNAMKKYIPESILSSVKQGFSSPDRSWFKGDSIDFVKEKLFNENAYIYNYLDKDITLKLVNEHLTGKENRRLLIWSLINFEEWCNRYDN